MWCWWLPYWRKQQQNIKKKCIKSQQLFKRGQIHTYKSKNKTKCLFKNFNTNTDLQYPAKGDEATSKVK